MGHSEADDSHEQEHQDQKDLIDTLLTFKPVTILRNTHATTLAS
ncbi:MAG TPA: hypothetical protein VMS94_03170 [Acidobacteriota bacterium]|nr:hypothetical protein [Acidobacteriota bacterium]